MQLNILADQLYFCSYNKYLSVCWFPGLYNRLLSVDINFKRDNFAIPANRAMLDAVMAKECPFTVSPVGFLRIKGRFLRGLILGEF